MKRILLVVLSVFVGYLTNAQIQKRDVLIGGSFGATGQQWDAGSSASNSSIRPFVKFAYNTNRTIGFTLDLFYSSNKSNNGQSKSNQFSFGPGVHLTQYHPLKGRFGWWLQEEAGVRFGRGKNISGSMEQRTKNTTYFANVTPGVFYAAGEQKNWLLTASVGGISGSYSGSNGIDSWMIGSSFFQYYGIGFAYIFRK